MKSMHADIEAFIEAVAKARDIDDLADALDTMTRRMGFAHFALTHHADILGAQNAMIRLHNYPEQWADYFDRNRLNLSDPVHRASHRTCAGFRWNQLPDLIQMTPADHRLLARARDFGLIDGFTVPANVVGESTGSCSFAIGPDSEMRVDALLLAQLAGIAAFEAARRLWLVQSGPRGPQPRLTDRQRDCLIWAARGKTDWEIALILGVSHETVVRHLKQARDRYGVQKRTSLLIRALFDGTISFADIFPR